MKHNCMLKIFVFVLIAGHSFIIGAATEEPKIIVGNDGVLINTTEHFAIGTLSLSPSDQVLYYKNHNLSFLSFLAKHHKYFQ